MALAQVNAGDKINASDINQFYNILKGVAASGESVTLIYNAAGAVILQPSSDPATGTELIQIKNNTGTVQMALSSDGKVYAGDGAVGSPGLTFEGDKDTGLYRIGANDVALAAGGVLQAEFTTAAATIVQPLTASGGITVTSGNITASAGDLVVTAGKISITTTASRIVPGATSLSLRNNANGADNLIIVDAGNATLRGTLTVSGASVSVGTNPSTTGALAVPNNSGLKSRNSTNNGDSNMITMDSSNNIAIGDAVNPIWLQAGAGTVDFRYAVTALGGGAAPTVGTIGGSGPGSAAQNSWLRININGTASYLPVWR